ncbi:MBL fold metallo-hydrolase [Nocardioides sp. GY 10113]|uniref:MBL fold metallo-hydrolase n=1 Tax=Nocardioides sp. GY 10113 TaxID=2569761 RepID=UPI0010A863ED|nr:MBL fold metallo-hydrolase [Nocardioides sp. GY 10113]TIC84855.1 MBL fold metallo-hydrolase [Nocardioides sp. GY 10113]
MRLTEIADRVWVGRYPWFDVNVAVVGGRDGLVVVDTYASEASARTVVDEVRALGAGAVRAVVNTHEHFDHVLGNHAFRQAFRPAGGELPIHAHEEAAARTAAAVRAVQDSPGHEDDPDWADLRATTVVPADHPFSSAAAIDLGDRVVELVHPGRGHTGGDLVVRIGDADVLLAGDLVEESGPPALGDDSFPMDWPATLDLVLGLTTADTVVVPGHGAPVDRRFVEDQRDLLGTVAETIRDLATRGVPEADALGAAAWPLPAEALADAVRRGYAQLPAVRRTLPMA